jgi:hypothetical protein
MFLIGIASQNLSLQAAICNQLLSPLVDSDDFYVSTVMDKTEDFRDS